MFVDLVLGIFLGAVGFAVFLYFYLEDPTLKNSTGRPRVVDQFKPIQIPDELREFLAKSSNGNGPTEWESCFALSLLTHFLYQEHKDTRALRRWMHKRLQLELNDITTRNAAGRLIQGIRIRDLSLGTKFPVIRRVCVEKAELGEDRESFESVNFLLDINYNGGFETSIDVTAVFGKQANIAFKVTRLSGTVRLMLCRQPYNHWAFSFIEAPNFDLDVSSQIQGHQLKHLIPLITQQFRRALHRKHVWPNYKVRYRPIFPNPLLQPSTPAEAFAHVRVTGGLEVTVLRCTRLNLELLPGHSEENSVGGCHYKIYCTVALERRPFTQPRERLSSTAAQNFSTNAASSATDEYTVSALLTFHRSDFISPIGLRFAREDGSSSGVVRVAAVDKGSLAAKADFRPGDVILAVNNLPVRAERQVTRILGATIGDLLVLVERAAGEDLNAAAGESPDDAFVCLSDGKPIRMDDRRDSGEGSSSATADHAIVYEEHPAVRRMCGRSIVRTSTSTTTEGARHTSPPDSLASSSLVVESSVPPVDRPHAAMVAVQRTESARVPALVVTEPLELRRAHSLTSLWRSFDTNETLLEDPSRHSTTAQASSSRTCPCTPSRTSRERSPRNSSPGAISSDVQPKTEATELVRSVSANTISKGTTDDGEDDDSTSQREQSLVDSRAGLRRRLQARALVLGKSLTAGRRRMMDFLPQGQHKSPSTTPPLCDSPVAELEVGADALVEHAKSTSLSATLTTLNVKSSLHESASAPGLVEASAAPTTTRWRRKRKAGATIEVSRDGPTPSGVAKEPSSGGGNATFSKSTKSIAASRDALWGQSLHFTLEDGAALRFLNLTVHAQETCPDGSVPENAPQPILLGYASAFLPQLLDDCHLTLSLCHREVLQLRPPAGVTPILETQPPQNCDLARHAAFDPRLCYGDVTLGFRLFPTGLPEGAGQSPFAADLSDDEESAQQQQQQCNADAEAVLISDGEVTRAAGEKHYWQPVTNRNASMTCALCTGRVWTRSGSRCSRCRMMAHTKCALRCSLPCATKLSSASVGEDTEEPSRVVRASTYGSAPTDHHSNPGGSGSGDSVAPPDSASTAGGGDDSSSAAAASSHPRLRTRVSEKLIGGWRHLRTGATSGQNDTTTGVQSDGS